MRTDRPKPHSLVGAYALDAIAGRDLVRFERHLAKCRRCAAELRELRQATAALAVDRVSESPPGLAERAIAAAWRTRQLPLAGGRQIARPSRAARIAVTVSAVAVVIAGFLGLSARTAVDRLGAQQSRAWAIAAVLAAPDTTVLEARVSTGGRATIVMSASRHALIFTATSLAEVPPSHCYELWLMGPKGDRPAGMLPGPRHGMTGPVLTSGLRPDDRLGLTVEPAGGSKYPSTTVLLVVAL